MRLAAEPMQCEKKKNPGDEADRWAVGGSPRGLGGQEYAEYIDAASGGTGLDDEGLAKGAQCDLRARGRRG